MTTEDFQIAARQALDDMKGGPESWTFLGLQRTESGAFRCVLPLSYLRAPSQLALST